MMAKVRLISHVRVDDKDIRSKITSMQQILETEEVKLAVAKTTGEIDNLWRRTINRHFDSTRNTPIRSIDKMVKHTSGMNPKGEWKPTEAWFTRSTSGRLQNACDVRVGRSGRLGVYMKRLPQTTSQKTKWQGADYGEFLRKGIGPSIGAYDPPSGKRMILSDDDGFVWWACGWHPGFTNKRWKGFVEEFKEEYKILVRQNVGEAVRRVVHG